MAQITFRGCVGVLANQDFILNSTDTTTDNGVVRNTYESTPLNFGQSCPAGVCEIRIIWNGTSNRWEIQLDNDGPANTPDYTTAVLYFSTAASYPNPPNISFGNWQNAGPCPDTVTVMSGDVQSGLTLNVEEVAAKNTIKVYPNPVKNILTIETTAIIAEVEVYTLVGKKVLQSNSKNINVSSLSEGLYLLKVTSTQGTQTIQRFIKK